MATTSAFGWETPDDTDLVKDGAAAIRTLGNSIDTSMSELKGGTTGQILSKTSNTDMDFTWVANDVGDITGITASSPLTGGGTSGAVTLGILNGTTSNLGAVQLSDSTSSTSTSLAATANAVKTTYDLANSAYAPAVTNNFYAGKNKIINGNFSVWQRGTSGFSVNGYTADQWYATRGNGSVGVSQQTFTPGAAPVSGYESQYFLRYALSGASTSGTPTLQQRIEDVRTLAGQTVTVSFWANASSSASPSSVQLVQNFGSGGSADVTTTVVTSPSYTTSFVRYSYTVSVPSISGKTVGTSSYLALVFNFPLNTTFTSFDIWGVQVEAGSVATPFQTASGGNQQSELAMCHRYFQYWTGSQYSRAGFVYADQTTNIVFVDKLPVPLRANPTVTFSNMTANGTAITSAGITNFSATSNTIWINGGVTGLTANTVYQIYVAMGATGVISYSAEL